MRESVFAKKVFYLVSALLVLFSCSIMISLGKEVFGYDSGYIPKLCMLLIECIGAFFFIRYAYKYPLTSMGRLILCWFVWVLFWSFFLIRTSLHSVIVDISFWVMVYFSFYYLFRLNHSLVKNAKVLFLLIAIACSCLFLQLSTVPIQILGNQSDKNVQVNYIFYVLFTLPW